MKVDPLSKGPLELGSACSLKNKEGEAELDEGSRCVHAVRRGSLCSLHGSELPSYRIVPLYPTTQPPHF